MSSHSRHTIATLFSAFLIFGVPPTIHGFMQTSTFLAWSNAPGASLEEFFGRGLPEPVISETVQQLPLDYPSTPLCPTGASSLIIFDLSESDQRANLESVLISSQINRQFNAAPESSRFWTNYLPDSLAERWTSELPLLWPSLCEGDVLEVKVRSGEDLDTVFHKTIEQVDEPRLVIMTTSPPPLGTSTLTTRAGPIKRGLPEGTLENSSMPVSSKGLPGPNTGVFWRYNFLSDYLIVGIFVMLLLFIPPVVLGSFALQSIESPKGLKTKMVGQVSEVKGN
ncbi:hypothetical protein PCANC_04160 [Puccinia coronata f. sp. avenae]|uniref:Protein BIG1 n=1 Tax=Puccinia coronata f. sp. avenae TaxID=200324 RepID=A0A2N5SU12_9BASI|nr:hypothetical protein PCASD_20607 [Puccinia coronata f. sp. avenae]PLW58157.1 hypothetical protein PCANC_04160 [Puccinia coronata f. sp. avenae]